MNGYESVIDYLCKKLGINPGETTEDGLVHPLAHGLYRLL